MLIRPLKLTGYQGLWGVVFKLFELRLWGQFIFISQIKCHKNFMPLALVDSMSALGLAIPINPTAKTHNNKQTTNATI